MSTTNSLKLETRGEREFVMNRVFESPRQLVWDAHTRPELVRKWMLGPDGWSMPVCEIDLRPGGRLRYVWRRDAGGQEMAMSGSFREVVPPERLVHTESFDDPWYPGEAIVTTTFEEQDGRTMLTMVMELESAEGRDLVLGSGMERGMEAGYERLDRMLQEM